MAICVSLPLLLGGAYYLNNIFQKHRNNRLQACRERQEDIVEKIDIYEDALAKTRPRPINYSLSVSKSTGIGLKTP